MMSKDGPTVAMFERQNKEKPFDYKEWEQHLLRFLVACDFPFDLMENQEFRAFVQLTHTRMPLLQIPSSKTVRRHIMGMGKQMEDEIKGLIRNHVGQVSLSLDAWISSNGYAFMGVVMHYVTQDWKMKELLVDFRELIGEHSGANMAAAVFETMTHLGLNGRVLSIVSNNAFNNDTMMRHLSDMLAKEGIKFDPVYSRVRCLPHTVHLAAIKLLAGLGALSNADVDKSVTANYQDIVTMSVDGNKEEDGVANEEMEAQNDSVDTLALGSLTKLRKLIRAIRSSPQRRQAWFREVKAGTGESPEVPKMLILDVRTRWSSTHQMCERALEYREVIFRYVNRFPEVCAYEITIQDWETIKLVCQWLGHFRAATTQISATKPCIISSAHAIFKGLQNSMAQHLRELSTFAPVQLRNALRQAHGTLGECFFKVDKSPYPIWATLLDPRINYSLLVEAYQGEGNNILFKIDTHKQELLEYYNANYAGRAVPLRVESSNTASGSTNPSFPVLNYASVFFKSRNDGTRNELEEYLQLPPEEYGDCDPFAWWGQRRVRFPNVSCLARDILSIPGSAVAVERIFSGGRDTISLWRASLKPETIRRLMLAKQKLRLDPQN